jgi:ribonuclease P/MRP protein subunit RPP40
MGFSTASIKWIQSYLSNRKQVLKFKKFTSTEETVLSGIPQGSIIGPILFIIFTNDLAATFKNCKMVSYADDCQLIVDAESLEVLKMKLQSVIETAQKWYQENSMKNNIGKTEILILSKRKHNNKVTIKVIDDGKEILITPEKAIKILGIYLDENMNWRRQINEVRRKASNAIRNLHRINSIVPVKQRLQLYNALVTPHFSYGDVIWGGCGAINTKRLQVTQNYAVKSMLGMKKRDSATAALTRLRLLNLTQRRKVHEVVFTHKALTRKQPENLHNMYEAQLPTRNTRAATNNKLNVPKHTTTTYQQSPFYSTVSTWNSIPSDLQYETTLQLKTQYQRNLIKQTYDANN